MTPPTRIWRPLVAVTLIGFLALVAGAATAQETPSEPPTEVEGAEAAPPADDTTDAVPYARQTYRDPFRSLLDKKPEEQGPRPPGTPGMLIEEIDLVGILSGPKGTMVLIIGSDGLGYSLTEGAPLYDGRVLRIDQSQQVVVFRQDVNDPTRIKPYRDIERRLDSAS